MHNRRFYFTITAALVFAAPPLFAGIPDTAAISRIDTATAAETIVVTASRSKRRVSETPAGVSVITRKTIESSPAKTVEDLIATQTGVQVKRSVSIGEGIPSDIIIRGIPGCLAGTRTLILVDGIPTNASGTPFTMINEIPMDAIERVEIVRGPYSSLYGANAFGGVVNIITREERGKASGTVNVETAYPFSAAGRCLSKGEPLAEALEKSGPLTYWNAGGTITGGAGKLRLMASTGYRSAGNYLFRDTAIAKNGSVVFGKPTDNHEYEEFRFFGKGKLYCTENVDISLHARYFQSDLGFGKTRKILPDSADVDTRGWKFLAGPHIRIALPNGGSLRAGAFFRHFEGVFLNEGKEAGNKWVPTDWKAQTNDWQVETQYVAKPAAANTLTAGIELLSNRSDFGATKNSLTGTVLPGSFSTNNGILNGALYIMDEQKLFGRLNIVPAARLDYHSVFGSAFSPKLGISYKIAEALRFRSSAGRSFRAPSLGELYLPDFPVSENVAVKANPRLRPEYIWGFDCGFDIMPANTFTLKMGPYYNRMNGLIVQALINDTSKYGFSITHKNVSRAMSEGVEAEMEWRPVRWLTVAVNGTFMKSMDLTLNAPLDYIPDYMADCRIAVSRRLWKIKIDGQAGVKHVASRTYLDLTSDETFLDYTPSGQWQLKYPPPTVLPPYTTIDLSCRVSFPRRISVTLAAQNLLDAFYEEAGGTLAPGRFATVKVGYAF